MTANPWDYGEEGLRYPVNPGETWALLKHTFACRSLLDGGIRLDVDLVYTDPPWQQGNVNAFRTKAGLPHADHHWLDLYRRVVELAAGAPLWLEGGRKQAAQVRTVLPGPIIATFDITYYRKHPCVLHYSGPVPPPCDPTGLDDEHTPGFVLSSYPAGVVADLCAGRGLTSRCAHRRGWRSINVELNPKRTSAALSRLADVTGVQPERVA